MDNEQNNNINNIPIFKNFNTTQFTQHPTICVIGKRGSGKTLLCQKLINKINKPVNLIISSEENPNPFCSETYPEAQRENELNIIDKHLENMNEECIILDNCLFKMTQINAAHNLLFNGRHYNKSSITIIQHPLGLTPDIRSSFDYVFIFYDDFLQNQQKYYSNYAGMFPTFDFFKKTFEQLTQNKGCMVIVNTNSTNIVDKVFYFEC